jgi:hypothetical protein
LIEEASKEYTGEVLKLFNSGEAREESYYPYLKSFLERISTDLHQTSISVLVLPKKTDAGNPDFKVLKGDTQVVGYIEAKSPDTSLDTVINSAQVKRYRNTFPNFILTNFIEFRFFRNGELHESASFYKERFLPVPFPKQLENLDQLVKLHELFLSFARPRITTSETLAIELAKRTRFLRDAVITEEIEEEYRRGTGEILGFYRAFQEFLIQNLSRQQFADLYSQTITFGLYSARMRSSGKFDRRLAVHSIPPTIGILREIFSFISCHGFSRVLQDSRTLPARLQPNTQMPKTRPGLL